MTGRPDWLETPFVRVYLTMIDDHPAVWADPVLLHGWLHLLVVADRLHPATAPIVGDVPEQVFAALVAEGCIDPVRTNGTVTGYRFHGLAGQRHASVQRYRAGGLQRAATAGRDAGGRMLAKDAGSDAGDPSSDAGSDAGDETLADAGDPTLVDELAAFRWTSSEPANTTQHDTGAGSVSLRSTEPAPPVGRTTREEPTPPPPARLTASAAGSPPPRLSRPPDNARCRDPEAHREQHAFFAGIGWKCPPCEQATVAVSDETFEEKMRRHGLKPAQPKASS